jgi:hypothetical protein
MLRTRYPAAVDFVDPHPRLSVKLVVLRGVELEKSSLMPPEDEIIPIPASRRGREGRLGSGSNP